MEKIGSSQNKFEKLRQAVESFIIADATCSKDDADEAYRIMLKIAELTEYLPEFYEEAKKS